MFEYDKHLSLSELWSHMSAYEFSHLAKFFFHHLSVASGEKEAYCEQEELLCYRIIIYFLVRKTWS